MGVMRRLREAIGMPPILLVVEVFIAFAILRNLIVFSIATFIIDPSIVHDVEKELQILIMIVMSIASSILLIKTMFGLPSADRYAWRASIRSIIFMILANLTYQFLGDDFINVLSLEEIILFSAISILILMIPSVRSYYIPPLTELPPIKWWIKLCFLRPIDNDYDYQFKYRESD
ncbi:MAG: hypothetical protein J6U12_06655 [Candidatus Methanomethylophilaceae archaeon]|nr:hypothetical protein [Candidatus Methanomethylophilaceae archaeon]MBP5735369.1 hypothetical protein [Candidatus Methanomethylophilaceae archaeon]